MPGITDRWLAALQDSDLLWIHSSVEVSIETDHGGLFVEQAELTNTGGQFNRLLKCLIQHFVDPSVPLAGKPSALQIISLTPGLLIPVP